jgi:glycosyltransferase involved in cell wall biosynthesis
MIKVVHISPVFNDSWSYQENLMVNIQAEEGFEVTVITSFDSIVDYKVDNVQSSDYYFGKVRILRLKFDFLLFNRFYFYKNLISVLESIEPDIIMIHGLQMLPLFQIKGYLSNKVKCLVYADFHSDYVISGRNFISKYFLHKIVWRFVIKRFLNCIEEVYYTRPSVKRFSKDMYGVNESQLKPLFLGSEFELPNISDRIYITKNFRSQFGINETDFVILSGGKITKMTNISNIILALNSLNSVNVHFILFGTMDELFFTKLLEGVKNKKNVHFIGWLNNKQVFEAMISSNCGIFLDRHSVLWEQAIGLGLPIIIKYDIDREYLNVENNVHFIFSELSEELVQTFKLLTNEGYYCNLRNNSIQASRAFNFSSIIKDLSHKWKQKLQYENK